LELKETLQISENLSINQSKRTVMRIIRNSKENRSCREKREHSLLYFETNILNNFDDPMTEKLNRFAS